MNDKHTLIAVDHTHRVYASPYFDSYDAALAAWYINDNERLAGRRPHVKFYAVRSTSDPMAQDAFAVGSQDPVFRSTIRNSRGFSNTDNVARSAIRRYVPEPKDRRYARHDITRRQGDGGWYFEASGEPMAQGTRDLFAVARRRGWIVQGADERWHVLQPEVVR